MSGLSPEIVIELMNEGLTQAAIAREYGVSRQYVNKLAIQGGHTPVVPIITENLPWDIPSDYYENTLYQGMRLIGHGNYTGFDKLNGSSLAKARAILTKLTRFRQVIDFDPSYPAMPGLTNTPGFAYVPRTEDDEDFIVKIRPGTRITPEGRKIWRLPEEMP